MSVGFGFSVGDFITGIQLVRDVILSLQSCAGSALEYQTLVYELFTLERALLEVKSLRFEDCEAAQLDALKCAATQCQSTIDRFLAKIKKYQPSLNAQGSGSKVRDGIRKIQWALCNKTDLEVFKAEVRGHAGSINILLATVQLNQARIFQQKTGRHQESVLSTLNRHFLEYSRSLGNVSSAITACAKQGQQLLQSMAFIVHSNIRIYQMVVQIHSFISTLPPQVERKQPVYFIDAFGKESAFFLEWVYSAEVLQDWLERRFEATGKKKILRKEYALEDTKTKRQIDLTKPWDTLFYPGMHVGMDMIFVDPQHIYKNNCPACQTPSSCNLDVDAICSHCGVKFRRINKFQSRFRRMSDFLIGGFANSTDLPAEEKPEKPRETRKRQRGVEDESSCYPETIKRRQDQMCQFRRLRLLDQLPPLASILEEFPRNVETNASQSVFWDCYGEPALTRLGIALVELALGMRLSQIRESDLMRRTFTLKPFPTRFDIDDVQNQDMLDVFTAKELLASGAVLQEAGVCYHDAVQVCLSHRVMDSSGPKVLSSSDPDFLSHVLRYVIQPIKDFYIATWPSTATLGLSFKY